MRILVLIALLSAAAGCSKKAPATTAAAERLAPEAELDAAAATQKYLSKKGK